eukprot:c11453_g1_i1.p1 GENE.c11453_g1_i1~~c11453_g1_i1.p1  ORF type:complete len:274 (-),score=95.78 c11453_g1_i1:83-904(-)
MLETDTISFVTESKISWLKPYEKYVPVIARFFLVATFFEDGLRMYMDSELQILYLQKRITYYGALFFLILSASMQIIGGLLVVVNHKVLFDYAVYTLILNLVLQNLVYQTITDAVLVLRNLSLIGGLLLLLSEKRLKDGKKAILSTPLTSSGDSTKYLQLAGRAFLALFLVAHLPFSSTSITFVNVVLVIISFIILFMVVVGLKTRFSAILLVVVVCVANVAWNSFWAFDFHHPDRDFFQYYFFQTVSIVGGLLLLVSVGPGSFSVDGRKKDF